MIGDQLMRVVVLDVLSRLVIVTCSLSIVSLYPRYLMKILLVLIILENSWYLMVVGGSKLIIGVSTWYL